MQLDIYVVFLGVCLCYCSSPVTGCGGYVLLSTTQPSRVINSPNHPAAYPDNSYCVWTVAAPGGYKVSAVVSAVLGQSGAGGVCMDYLQIRNGSSEKAQMYKACMSSDPVTVTSHSRWLWFKFVSDDTVANTGFRAECSLVESPGNENDPVPFITCQTHRYSCPNKECTHWAYRCDGLNDCGCSHGGCDEDEMCNHGLNISLPMKVGIGVGVGVVAFVIIFFGIGLIDHLLKMRAEKQYQDKMDEIKRLEKLKRAQKMAAQFFAPSPGPRSSISGSQTGSDGGAARRDAPPLSLSSSINSGSGFTVLKSEHV